MTAAIFLVIAFTNGMVSMTPMHDAATCKAMAPQAIAISGGSVSIREIRCVSVEDGAAKTIASGKPQ